MGQEINLELDWDGDGDDRIARVMVADVFGYTRQGAPTVSASCGSPSALQREIERLKEELDDIARRGAEGFGSPRADRPSRPAPQDADGAAEKPHLSSELQVGDVMTREVRTVGRNDKISVADEMMRVERFRHVIVLDEDERVAGVLSHRDIVYGALAWTLGQGRAAHDEALASYPVKDVMAADVVTVDSATPLRDAAQLMIDRKVGCLPVVDGEHLVGVLTEGDFLALLSD